MWRVLRRGLQAVELLQEYEHHPADICLKFPDATTALYYLRTFTDEPVNMLTMRASLVEAPGQTAITHLDDQEVLEQLAWRLITGHVKIVPFPATRPAIYVGVAARTAGSDIEDAAVPPVVVTEDTTWIEIELIDEEGLPVVETYRMVLPDGSQREGRLNSNGRARAEGIKSGMCKISFPKLGITVRQQTQTGGRTG